jgi:RNA methyltransferase, TrmH family
VLTRREERLLRSLRVRKSREAEGLFLAEGVRAVEDLAASPLAVRLAAAVSSLGDSERGAALLEALQRRGVPVREIGERELAAVSDTATPQGIVAVGEIPAATLGALEPPASGPVVLLVLDGVQDPGNLGTLVRTAEALGAFGVALLPGTADAWGPRAVRAAMGSSFRLPLPRCGWDELAPWLTRHAMEPVAAAVGGEPVLPGPVPRVALVLGNEGAGVSAETLRRARRRVGVPLRGRAESLNVAAAGAILLHDLLR